jgi:hypothetical protein
LGLRERELSGERAIADEGHLDLASWLRERTDRTTAWVGRAYEVALGRACGTGSEEPG